jgi:guanylate kinase
MGHQGGTTWIRKTLAAACAVVAAGAPPHPPPSCPCPCPWARPQAAAPAAAHAGGVFVLSGPSGVGKSSLAKRLAGQVPGLGFAVSHTTRPPRPGEKDGVDYFFVDRPTFDRMLAEGAFAEWVETYGHRYGLSRRWLNGQAEAGKDVLMDLDTAGARIVRQALPGSITILVLPPSAQELERRLRGRGTESAGQLERRLGQARRELARFPE